MTHVAAVIGRRGAAMLVKPKLGRAHLAVQGAPCGWGGTVDTQRRQNDGARRGKGFTPSLAAMWWYRARNPSEPPTSGGRGAPHGAGGAWGITQKGPGEKGTVYTGGAGTRNRVVGAGRPAGAGGRRRGRGGGRG